MIVEDLSTLKPGQKVRVTYEGIVNASTTGLQPGQIVVAAPGYTHVVLPEYKVEIVEPDYLHGGTYQDASGQVWTFDRYYRGPDNGEVWFSPGSAEVYDFDVPARPLAKLVPEANSA
jgi:hypothetical protein